MTRLSNARVMVSLLCALVPAVTACGGGGDSADAAAPIDDMMMDEVGGSGGTGSSGGTTSIPGSGGSTAGSGGTSAATAGTGSGGSKAVGDTTAPTIVATLPEDGAIGLSNDATVEIEFSEPMDTASVEAAYQSADLPVEAIAFAWNDEGTKLTVTPGDKLEYAMGNDPAEVVAKIYAITIAGGAMDVAQNEMGEDATLSFSTLREISANLAADSELSGHVDGAASNSVTIQAGDTVGDDSDRGLMTFDLSSVPTEYALVSAELVARQISVTNNPFLNLSSNAPSLAELMLFAHTFAARNDAMTALPDVPIGTFSQSPTSGQRSLPVLDVLTIHLIDRETLGNRSQYALQFGKLTDTGGDVDKVQFAGAMLSLTYLTP